MEAEAGEDKNVVEFMAQVSGCWCKCGSAIVASSATGLRDRHAERAQGEGRADAGWWANGGRKRLFREKSWTGQSMIMLMVAIALGSAMAARNEFQAYPPPRAGECCPAAGGSACRKEECRSGPKIPNIIRFGSPLPLLGRGLPRPLPLSGRGLPRPLPVLGRGLPHRGLP